MIKSFQISLFIRKITKLHVILRYKSSLLAKEVSQSAASTLYSKQKAHQGSKVMVSVTDVKGMNICSGKILKSLKA